MKTPTRVATVLLLVASTAHLSSAAAVQPLDARSPAYGDPKQSARIVSAAATILKKLKATPFCSSILSLKDVTSTTTVAGATPSVTLPPVQVTETSTSTEYTTVTTTDTQTQYTPTTPPEQAKRTAGPDPIEGADLEKRACNIRKLPPALNAYACNVVSSACRLVATPSTSTVTSTSTPVAATITPPPQTTTTTTTTTQTTTTGTATTVTLPPRRDSCTAGVVTGSSFPFSFTYETHCGQTFTGGRVLESTFQSDFQGCLNYATSQVVAAYVRWNVYTGQCDALFNTLSGSFVADANFHAARDTVIG